MKKSVNIVAKILRLWSLIIIIALQSVVFCGGFQIIGHYHHRNRAAMTVPLFVASSGVEETMSVERKPNVPPRQLLLHWK
jgi:hypothetical protein